MTKKRIQSHSAKLLLALALLLLLFIPTQSTHASVKCRHNQHPKTATNIKSATKRKLTGLVLIKGKYYIFNKSYKPATGNGKHNITVGNAHYIVNSDGSCSERIHFGWQIDSKDRLYYTCTCGMCFQRCVKFNIHLSKTGAADPGAETNYMKSAVRVADAVSNVNAPPATRLRQCWNYIVSSRNFRYSGKYPVVSREGFHQLGMNMLATHSGNCYGFACGFAALAKAVGYHPVVVHGLVHGSRDHRADGYTRHSWVQIKGLNYDPEGQFAGWRTGCYGWGSYNGIIMSRIAV